MSNPVNVSKLHPKVEQKITASTARDMLYQIARSLCPYDDEKEPDIAGAITALEETKSVLQSASGGDTTTTTMAEKTEQQKNDSTPVKKEVEFASPEAFMSWVLEQFSLATKEEGDALNKRIEHLASVIALAKAHWESQGEKPPAGFKIELVEAYVGSGGAGAKTLDLTATDDQKEGTMKALSVALRANTPAKQNASKTSGFCWPSDITKSEDQNKDES